MRLAIGDVSGALEDANEALALAPDYSEASAILFDVVNFLER